MASTNIENFLNRLHVDPSFELAVRGAVLSSLAQFDLGEEEGALLFSEGLARVELSSISRAATMGNYGAPDATPRTKKTPKKTPPKAKKK